MKKASIFYFSGTGNTWWVSEIFARVFNEKGISASAYSIEKISGSRAGRIIDESDLVGFGFPTHGSDLPFIMKEFFQKLHPKTLAKTEKRIRGFIEKIMNGRPFRRGFNKISEVSGAFQRVPFRRFFEQLRDDIFYEKSICIQCRKCARLCPSGNLEFEGKELKTKGTCILCLRCYSFCPVSAITHMNKPHNLKRGEPYKGPVVEFKEKDGFVALIVILQDSLPVVETMYPGFEKEVVDVITSAQPLNGTFWLMVPVKNSRALENLKDLLVLKHDPEKYSKR